MLLRWKSLLYLALAILGVNLILYVNARLIILKSYVRLEEDNALQDMKRVQAVLQDDLSHLGLTAHNIASHDDAYAFLAGNEQGTFSARFAAPNHTHLDTHLMAFVTASGDIRLSRYYDPASRAMRALPADIAAQLRHSPYLWRHSSRSGRFEGLVTFPEGPMLMVSSPVTVPGQPSRVAGALVMGSFLDRHHVNLLAEISRLSLSVQPALSPPGTSAPQAIFPLPLASSPVTVAPRDDEVILGRIHLTDVYGQPVRVLQAEIPRRIYRQGLVTLRYFLIWSLGLSSAFGLLIYLILARLALVRTRRQESEDLFHCLVEQAPDAFFLYDLQRGFIDVNRWACQALDYLREDFCGRKWPLLGPGPAGLEEHWRRLNPGEQAVHQSELQRRDGTTFPVEISVTRFEAQGRRLLLALARDISARLRSERSLRESEQRFRKLSQEFQVLLDGISDSITLLSPDLRVVWGNRAASAMFGLQERELLGKSCGELWHGHAHPCDRCPAQESLQSGEACEGLDQTPDGRTWEIKAFPLKDGSGRVTGVIRFASDITEKTRLREENLRSGRLAALGELSAGVAHEINNPNGLILMSVPTLRDAFADAWPILDDYCRNHGGLELGGIDYAVMREEIPALLCEMTDGARRIKRIVEDLKNFARPQDHETDASFDLNEAVARALRLVATPLGRASERFTCELAPGSLPVRGVSQRIEQVLVNLVLNACQALPSPDRGLWVRTRRDPQGESALVEVQDEGCGIAPEHLSHITDPFFTTRREAGGTGLGLSVSARIVREHQGVLEFSSRPGRGTTVVVRLPLCPTESNP